MPSSLRLARLSCVARGRRVVGRQQVGTAPRAAASAPAAVTPAPVEIKDVMDASLGAVDKKVYDWLRNNAPEWIHFTPFTRTLATQGIMCAAIIMLFQVLAKIAQHFHDRIVHAEEKGMEDQKKATTVTLLKPLATMLPIAGWLIAFQRMVTGLDTITSVCAKHPLRFKNAHDFIHLLQHLADLLLPLKCYLANATGIVCVISLTWTLMLLKNRWFESFLAKMRVDSYGGSDSAENANVRRAMLPANSLANWIMVGICSVICLKLVGLDPSPILTLGSVSGLLVGFASQQLLLNLISGISIFITRPFIVGDTVSVRSGASVIANGTIVNISPLRTTFLDANSHAVTLPNKTLSDMIITNLNRDPTRVLDRVRTKTSQRIKHIMEYEFLLKRPPSHQPTAAYDAYARSVIKALLVRLSILPNIMRDTASAYVFGLNATGEILIKVTAMGVVTPTNPPETGRQQFLLAIHKALCTCESEAAVAR